MNQEIIYNNMGGGHEEYTNMSYAIPDPTGMSSDMASNHVTDYNYNMMSRSKDEMSSHNNTQGPTNPHNSN